MANNVMCNVSENFDLKQFAEKLTETYKMKGYSVAAASMNNSSILTIEKGVGGINMILGMGEGIKATCMLSGNTLSISFSDGDWTGKIIACAVGWFLCFIPVVTGVIGISKQTKLPKDIANDAMMIASNM